MRYMDENLMSGVVPRQRDVAGLITLKSSSICFIVLGVYCDFLSQYRKHVLAFLMSKKPFAT